VLKLTSPEVDKSLRVGHGSRAWLHALTSEMQKLVDKFSEGREDQKTALTCLVHNAWKPVQRMAGQFKTTRLVELMKAIYRDANGIAVWYPAWSNA
jgi:hypothetical protein